MKVVHLYAGNLFGGREKMLISLAQQQFQGAQAQHDFVVCFPGKLADSLAETGAMTYLIGPGRVQLSRPWSVWQARRDLRILIYEENYDVVISHGYWVQILLGPLIRQLHLPFVFWAPDTPKGEHWLEQLAKRVRPDWVIANSYYTQSAMPLLYPQVPCTVIYNPVVFPVIADRLEVRKQVREELQTPETDTVIIQVSRLEPWKGHQLLLSALTKLSGVPHWRCWMVGGAQRPHEAVYFKELESQVEAAQLTDRVQFLGQRFDVPRLLVAADIHCQPNTGPEPFGIGFIEALYAGLPVVTTAMGGGLEIVDSSCGCLVPANDGMALSAKLHELITNPDLRRALGSQGPKRAQQLCDPLRQTHKLEAFLARIQDGRSIV